MIPLHYLLDNLLTVVSYCFCFMKEYINVQMILNLKKADVIYKLENFEMKGLL